MLKVSHWIKYVLNKNLYKSNFHPTSWFYRVMLVLTALWDEDVIIYKHLLSNMELLTF